MTIRQNVPRGAPCWVDLMSSDTERARSFYGELFGWVAGDPDPDFGGYANFTKDGEPVAGLMAAQPDMGPGDVWSVYLAVEDAAATVADARESGGQVYVDAMPVADLGVMAVLADAGGAMVGLWQPGAHRGGVVAASGAPCHFELHARDYEATVAFYETVFGWEPEPVSDTPDFRYTVLNVADGENAGIMDASGLLPEGAPASWQVYFAVDDIDKALATVEKLGGATVQPAEDTPYGRIASVTDAAGAAFKLRADCC